MESVRQNSSKCQGRAESFVGICDRKPSVERDGKPYCWQHDPERKRKEAQKKWEERKWEMRQLEEKIDAEIERKRLLKASGVSALTNEQLVTIIEAGGVIELIEFWADRQG